METCLFSEVIYFTHFLQNSVRQQTKQLWGGRLILLVVYTDDLKKVSVNRALVSNGTIFFCIFSLSEISHIVTLLCAWIKLFSVSQSCDSKTSKELERTILKKYTFPHTQFSVLKLASRKQKTTGSQSIFILKVSGYGFSVTDASYHPVDQAVSDSLTV